MLKRTRSRAWYTGPRWILLSIAMVAGLGIIEPAMASPTKVVGSAAPISVQKKPSGSDDFSSYSKAVLSQEPSAFYPFNELRGTTAADLSPNKNNASYVGTPTFGQPGVFPDKSVTSVGMNGDSGYVQGNDLPPLEGANDRTVEMWFQGSQQGTLFHAGQSGHTQSFDLTVLDSGPGGCRSPSGPGLS